MRVDTFDISVRLRKCGPGRYKACVCLGMDVLTGHGDDTFGVVAEGTTPGESIESAAAKALAMIHSNPQLGDVLIPLAGPQLASVLVAARSLDAPRIVRKFDKPTRGLIRLHAASLRRASAKVERPAGKAVVLLSKRAVAKYDRDVKSEVRAAIEKERKKLEKQIAAELGLEGLTVADAKKLAKKEAKEYADSVADKALVGGAAAVGAYFGGPVGASLAASAMDKYGKEYLKSYAEKAYDKAEGYAEDLYEKVKFW